MTNAFKAELAHFEELETTLQRRRRVLEIQCARFGDLTPAWIILELEDIEKQLAQVQANLRQMRSTATDTRCPYVGLLTFQEDDTTFFFGRDALVGEMLGKVEHTSFLAVLGPSGSGKSSVVRAGLIPALKRGAIPGSDQWYYLPSLKPGARPLNTLAATLAAEQEGKLGDIAAIRAALRDNNDGLLLMVDGLRTGYTDARLVFVVDQAEELWTLAPTESTARTAFITEQQQPFIHALLTAADTPDQSILIILTMRADFLHRAIEHHDLAQWIGEHDVMVSPLLPDELRSAITRPAELVGGSFEPGLVDTLVEQTIGQPGALPLLEYTLFELWKDPRPDNTLTWEAFQRLGGGVEGGLARRADTILTQKYTPEQQAELRAMLLRLIQPGEGTADTRRRVSLDDLVPAGSSVETVHALLKPLTDERLITTGYNPASDEETVEVSHEALIRAWPTLGAWITTARTDLRLHIQLSEAAKDWVTSGENPDLLWSGLRLANAQAWLERARPWLNERDQRFLEASYARRQAEIAAEEAARQRELKRVRRDLFVAIGVLVGAVIAVVVTGWLWYRTTIAEQRAFAQLLVAKGQTVYEDHPLLGVRLAIEGLAWLPPNDPARTELISITVQLAKYGRLEKLASDGSSIFPSPNHTLFALARGDAPGELRHSTGGTRFATLAAAVRNVTFSPDSKLFMVQYFDKPPELRRSDGSIIPLTGTVQSVTFSPDSTLLVVQYSDKPTELRRADGSIITTLTGAVQSVTFSPDSTLLVVQYSDKPTELRRADGSIITTLAGTAEDITFDPDSKLFVVRYFQKPDELRRADGSIIITFTGILQSVTFSPDSTLLVVQYSDVSDELRRADGSIITTLTSTVSSVTFSPDSKLLVVRYFGFTELRRADGSIIPFSAATVQSVTFSPNSKLFVVRYFGFTELRRADGSIITTLTTTVRDELRRADGSIIIPVLFTDQPVTFSTDSTLFVVQQYSDKPGELRRADGSIITTLTGAVQSVTFSPDSKLFVVQYSDKRTELRGTQSPMRPLITLSSIRSFTYDSRVLHVTVLHHSGQVYILDTTWLSAIVDYPEMLSENEIIERTCAGPLSGFDKKEMLSYLENRTPKECR